MGRHWFYYYPKDIAKFLKKPNWEKYAGHSICRTGATVYADCGVSMSQLKKYGGWKSNAVAEQYHTNSLVLKIDTANTITSSINGDDNDNHNNKRKRKRK